MSAYDSLVENSHEINLLSRTAAVLGWDQETYMPENGVDFRAKQLAYLSGKIHALATNPEIAQWLEKAASEIDPDSIEAANLREWKFAYERAICLPQELVERSSRASSMAKAAWAKARTDNNFAAFAPHLETLLEIAREKADRFGFKDEPYDALLCGFERGAKTSEVAARLDALREPLAELAQQALAKSKNQEQRPLPGPFPIEDQMTLNQEVAEALGFDFAGGRIDTTTHPFCTTLGPDDVRLTTRYETSDFTSSLFGVMHEAGHGLYEQNSNKDQAGLPCGSPVSLGIHESQSRLWENHLGRSRAFWQRWLPRAKELFPALRDWELDEFLATINRPCFSFIRVEADELTYDLHIILRFSLERQMLNGTLKVADLPDAWNAEFKELFGLDVPDDTRGCLQDIHWSMGAMGYFPTYSLGNLNAAQLFDAACADGTIKAAIAVGNYLPLRDWMRAEIHQQGSRYFPDDLIERATGRAPEIDTYLKHLTRRYGS